ncbi:hypothetical protein [Kibdelosporangium philippinense]|uniref:hypothetical protein n=1 Tax=Kibdelosporangium philippinense TaxID=211113 RepID=UPI00361F1726
MKATLAAFNANARNLTKSTWAAFEHFRVHYGQRVASSVTCVTIAPPITECDAAKATLTALNALNSALTPSNAAPVPRQPVPSADLPVPTTDIRRSTDRTCLSLD